MSNFNQLTESETERLAKLIEECAEVQQIACKILRHGYSTYNPYDKEKKLNRWLLETEVGDLLTIINMMIRKNDIDSNTVSNESDYLKEAKILKYMHHQE